MRRLTLVLLLVAICTACRRIPPQPLDPQASAKSFQARRLSDPALRDFLQQHLGRPPERWDLETLTWAACYYHPDLEAARARAEASEAAIASASARPNPSFSATPTWEAGTAPGVSPWTLAFALEIPLETAGKRGARIERARKLSEASRLELAEAAWEVRRRLRTALAEALLSEREAALRGAEEALLQDLSALLERRQAVGAATMTDLVSSRAELAEARLAAQRAQGRSKAGRVALASALGLPVSALDGGVDLAWPTLDHPPGEERLPDPALRRAGLLNRLDLRRGLAEYAAEEAALQLELAGQYPELRLGPGYTYDQGADKYSFGLSVTLPVLDQHQGPIAEAEAKRKEAAVHVLSLQAQAIGQTETASSRYRSALSALSQADRSLGEATEAADPTSRRGRTDALLTARLLLRRAQACRARLEALGEAQAALGGLEDSVKKPLDGEAPP